MENISAQKIESSYVIPEKRSKWPKILAEMFCSMNNVEQATFFDEIACFTKVHFEHRAVFQWRSMQDFLTRQAKQIIDDIKDHTDEEAA